MYSEEAVHRGCGECQWDPVRYVQMCALHTTFGWSFRMDERQLRRRETFRGLTHLESEGFGLALGCFGVRHAGLPPAVGLHAGWRSSVASAVLSHYFLTSRRVC